MSDIPYSAQIRITELLERAKAQSTALKIFRDGAQIVPTSGTYTLKKPTGANIVTDVALTINDAGTASYNHSAEELADTLGLGEGYVQEFSLTIGGSVYLFRRMASVVLRRLYPTVQDGDLTATYTDLASLRPSSLTSYQTYIDDAWYQLLRRIKNQGMGYEYLVMNPESFFDVHRHLTLYLIFRDFHSSLSAEGRYMDLSQEHWRLYREEFDSISFIYDDSHNLTADNPDKRTRGRPTIFLSRPGQNYLRRRY